LHGQAITGLHYRHDPSENDAHHFELRFGAARSAKPGSLWAKIQSDIIDRFQVLPFTEQDALTAADEWLWGEMGVQGMVCHLSDSFRLCTPKRFAFQKKVESEYRAAVHTLRDDDGLSSIVIKYIAD